MRVTIGERRWIKEIWFSSGRFWRKGRGTARTGDIFKKRILLKRYIRQEKVIIRKDMSTTKERVNYVCLVYGIEFLDFYNLVCLIGEDWGEARHACARDIWGELFWIATIHWQQNMIRKGHEFNPPKNVLGILNTNYNE